MLNFIISAAYDIVRTNKKAAGANKQNIVVRKNNLYSQLLIFFILFPHILNDALDEIVATRLYLS